MPRTRCLPAGRLELLIDEWLDGTRKRWADGKKRGTLEQQIESFILGLEKAAETKRILEEERERTKPTVGTGVGSSASTSQR